MSSPTLTDIVLAAHNHVTACQTAHSHAQNREQSIELASLTIAAQQLADNLRTYFENGGDAEGEGGHA